MPDQDEQTTLPAAMTGRASPAKAAVGDKPVFAYISSLPQPQRSIAERVDALAYQLSVTSEGDFEDVLTALLGAR
jgi:hypothetical protein